MNINNFEDGAPIPNHINANFIVPISADDRRVVGINCVIIIGSHDSAKQIITNIETTKFRSFSIIDFCVSSSSSGRRKARKTDEDVNITVQSDGPITKTANVKLYATAELQFKTHSSNSG
jgi:hypothetical protein